MSRGIVALVFRSIATTKQLNETEEAERICWIPTASLASHMSEAYVVRILDACEAGSPVEVRSHDGTALLNEEVSVEFLNGQG